MINRNLASRYQILRYVGYFRWTIIYALPLFIYFSTRSGLTAYPKIIFLLFIFGTVYNLFFYFYLKYNPLDRIREKQLDVVAFVQIVLDQLFFTVIIYLTGGIESLSFLYYFLTIFIAVSLFSELVVIILAMSAVIQYVGLILLEYYQLIPHFQRFSFDSNYYLNPDVAFHNTMSVVFVLLLTTFVAALVSRLMTQKTEAVTLEENRVNYILNNLLDGIILLGEDKQIIFRNLALEKIFKFPQSFLEDILHNDKVDNKIKPLKDFLENEQIILPEEKFILEVDKPKNKIIQGISLPLFDNFGKSLGWLKILQDVTQEKEIDRIKSDFISIAAHQLRTPLAHIKWLFRMLISEDLGSVNTQQKELLIKGAQNNEKLISLVNDLLNISEIEEGVFAYKFKKMSVEPAAEEVIKELKDSAAEKNVELIYQVESAVSLLKIDKFKFKIALENLINNAITYNRVGGKIEVILKEEEGKVILSVSDTGVGIPPSEQKLVFSKFYRSKNAQDLNSGGSGLGLYITKSIIEGHGGTLEFKSKLDEGTTFTIAIPVDQPIQSIERAKQRKKEEVEKIINYI